MSSELFFSALSRRCATYQRASLSGTPTAAVLIPVVSTSAGPSLLFTVRSQSVRTHPGLACFPGGRINPRETPADAALREAKEELGLELHAATPLWAHDDGLALGVHVTPHVVVVPGDWSDLARLTLCPREVASAFTLPIAHLADDAHHTIEMLSPRGRERAVDGAPRRLVPVPSYTGGPVRIWGFTAWVVSRLLETLLVPAMRDAEGGMVGGPSPGVAPNQDAVGAARGEGEESARR